MRAVQRQEKAALPRAGKSSYSSGAVLLGDLSRFYEGMETPMPALNIKPKEATQLDLVYA